ncbi:MAG: AtpZ/AtpI family protein [Parvularculaceae bacterium]
MADDAGKQEPPSLDELGDRLKAARGEDTDAEPSHGSGGAAMGRALRVASELLAGLFVGALLGVGLDRWLGTGPWLLLVGIALGFAAGVRNVARAFQEDDAPSEDG